ncbi:MAG: hypothetical protein N4A40_09990 [Tissierellales bacterium]|jgi:hypothetical protein|nr:hypothetical protein [Tissierellales bacterium]
MKFTKSTSILSIILVLSIVLNINLYNSNKRQQKILSSYIAPALYDITIGSKNSISPLDDAIKNEKVSEQSMEIIKKNVGKFMSGFGKLASVGHLIKRYDYDFDKHHFPEYTDSLSHYRTKSINDGLEYTNIDEIDLSLFVEIRSFMIECDKIMQEYILIENYSDYDEYIWYDILKDIGDIEVERRN